MTRPSEIAGLRSRGRIAAIAKVPATVFALGIVSLLNDLGGDAVTPLLPAFVASVGGGPEALGIIEGIADATASIIQFASGYLADRTGRQKGLALAGYGIANSLRPLLSLATGWWQILVIRFGDRVGKGVRGAPRDALLANATPAALRGTAYGVHRGLDHVGAFLGPGIAYFMLSNGISVRAVFAWTALAGALCIAVLTLFVRDTARRSSAQRLMLGLPASAGYRRFLLAVLIFTLGNSSDVFLLWRAREIGMSVALAPILWMVLHVVKSAGSFCGGALSDWSGRRVTIVSGWGLYAAVYLGFALASRSWQIWALIALYGAFYGLTEGATPALVADLVDEDWRGRAFGTYNAVVGLAALPASVIFGLLYQSRGPASAFGLGAVLAVIASLVFLSSRSSEVGGT